MNRDQAKEIIKRDVLCTDYLSPAPNYKPRSNGDVHGLCCPFCKSGTHGKGSTGAVKYYASTNTWTCHSCGRGHDVIDAFMAQNGCDYVSAVSYLADRAGLQIDGKQDPARDGFETRKEKSSPAGQTSTEEKAKAQGESVSADYTEYYQRCAERLTDPAAVSYLKGRGIDLDIAQAYGMGFDPEADPASAPGAMGHEYKPHPSPRIIVPCSSSCYVGRSTDPFIDTAYKAMNPKGAEIIPFNADALRSTTEPVFVVEGMFDALSFLQVGHEAVALNSKNNGEKLVDYVRKNGVSCEGIIICPDNETDDAKQADVMERAEKLKRDLLGLNVPTVIADVTGSYHDANDALTSDPEDFKRNIDEVLTAWANPCDEITSFLDKVQTEAYRPHETGLRFFDNLTGGGIVNQSLLLLMAAPGTGKTTLAQQIAETMAKRGRPVLYFNFEMSREQMIAKAISAKVYHYGLNMTTLQILQGYRWTPKERESITAAIEDYRKYSYPYIKYNPDGASSELESLLKYIRNVGNEALAKGQQAPCVVVDYLHLIKSKDGLDSQELIKQIVTGLKQYAVDFDTFVIGIVATNRDSNSSGRITMESGRDSSNLEYTADYQISLNYYKVDTGEVKPKDVAKIAELQRASKRAMILRTLKSRFSTPGRSERVVFDAAHNTFYGVEDKFIPANGLRGDDGYMLFGDDDSDVVRTI